MEVNRHLEDRHFDALDHALGRPVNPLGRTERNHYATDEIEAAEMLCSPHWEFRGRVTDMSMFSVTEAGKLALRDHLRAIGDRTRSYVVSFRDYERTVPGTSPSKARYAYYLRISDLCDDLSFKEFLQDSRVRLAG